MNSASPSSRIVSATPEMITTRIAGAETVNTPSQHERGRSHQDRRAPLDRQRSHRPAKSYRHHVEDHAMSPMRARLPLMRPNASVTTATVGAAIAWSGHVVEDRLWSIGHPPLGDDRDQPNNGCGTGPTLGECVSETERDGTVNDVRSMTMSTLRCADTYRRAQASRRT